MIAPSPACPESGIAALTFPEQLILWALRQWTTSRESWPCVEREFRRACRGAAGVIAAQALAESIGLIGARSRRQVQCHALACRQVSADEAAFLSLIAASQACDRYTAETQARDLMPDSLVPLLLENIAVLGAALAAADRSLPPRYALPGDGVTIH
jgi:hypothetical protein